MAALAFTGLSLQQSRVQNQLAESGQITDRFNNAVTNLGSSAETIRLGGVYALQRVMRDSPRDQPAVVQVLAAFVRAAPPQQPIVPNVVDRDSALPVDVQTAVTAIVTRDPTWDQGTVISLRGANLNGANLDNAQLNGADLNGVHLYSAKLIHADLGGANLTGAILSYVNLTGANLNDAQLTDANLNGAQLEVTDLRGAYLDAASFIRADLDGANFTRASLYNVDLTHANLSNAILDGASLGYTDLSNVHGANLKGAHLAPNSSLCSGMRPLEPARGYVCQPW